MLQIYWLNLSTMEKQHLTRTKTLSWYAKLVTLLRMLYCEITALNSMTLIFFFSFLLAYLVFVKTAEKIVSKVFYELAQTY